MVVNVKRCVMSSCTPGASAPPEKMCRSRARAGFMRNLNTKKFRVRVCEESSHCLNDSFSCASQNLSQTPQGGFVRNNSMKPEPATLARQKRKPAGSEEPAGRAVRRPKGDRWVDDLHQDFKQLRREAEAGHGAPTGRCCWRTPNQCWLRCRQRLTCCPPC